MPAKSSKGPSNDGASGKPVDPVTTAHPSVQFYFYLGRAINRWAYIDRDLFHIFQFSLGSNNVGKAAYIFYKMTGIKDHFEITDTLVNMSVTTTRLLMWNKIKASFIKIIPFRNRLAHDPSTQITLIAGVAHGSSTVPPPAPPPPVSEWLLETERAKLLRPKKQDEKPITQTDIVKHLDDVMVLENEIRAFRLALPKRLRKRPSKPRAPSPPQGKGRQKRRAPSVQ